MDHGQVSLVCKLGSFTWAKINILKIMQNLFLICSNLYLEHARSAYLLISISFLFAHCSQQRTDIAGHHSNFLRPMTPEIEPSYNEETLHETLRTGKGLKKVQDYFLVQNSWSQPRTCFLSTVTFYSAFSFKVAN